MVGVNPEQNALLIKGAVPGPKKSIVTVRTAVKVQRGTKQEAKPLVDWTKKGE